MIEKISGLSGMKNLRILSLGRNYIKSISGLVIQFIMIYVFLELKINLMQFAQQDGVADTLEELWLSYNLIDKLKGINGLKKLRVLYMSNNMVRDWVEFNRLQEVTTLEDLLFVGNPLYENMADDAAWRNECVKRLPFLKKLDGETVVSGVASASGPTDT